MTFRYDFIGAGGLAYDLVMRVDKLPLGDAKYPAAIEERLPGGFIANATCAAARLGLRTGYIGWVGEDPEGAMLAEDFEQWDVDITGLMQVRGANTPFTLVIVDRKGNRAIVVPSFPLYQENLTYDQAQLAAQARVIYTFPRDPVWCRQLRQSAMDSGGALVFDVETAVPMRGDELRRAIGMADIVFFSENSHKGLKLPPLDKLVGPRQWLIMTAGQRGAIGIAHGMRKPVKQRALKVDAEDTTGAGDTFRAALIAAKLNGADLPEALAFANAAAAIQVQRRGARGGLPTRQQVEMMLRSSK